MIGLDAAVMGTSAANTKHKYTQVLVDHATRYVRAIPTTRNSAAAIKENLERLFKTGLQFKSIFCDNAKNFTTLQTSRGCKLSTQPRTIRKPTAL